MHPRCLSMHQPSSRRPPAHLSACGSSVAIRSSASPDTCRMAAPAGGVAFMLGVAAAGAAGVPERVQDVQAELGLDGRCSAQAGGRRRRRQLAVAAGMPPLAKPALQRNLGGSFGPARAPSQLSPACRGRAGLAGLPYSTSCAALLVQTHVCARLQMFAKLNNCTRRASR